MGIRTQNFVALPTGLMIHFTFLDSISIKETVNNPRLCIKEGHGSNVRRMAQGTLLYPGLQDVLCDGEHTGYFLSVMWIA